MRINDILSIFLNKKRYTKRKYPFYNRSKKVFDIEVT